MKQFEMEAEIRKMREQRFWQNKAYSNSRTRCSNSFLGQSAWLRILAR